MCRRQRFLEVLSFPVISYVLAFLSTATGIAIIIAWMQQKGIYEDTVLDLYPLRGDASVETGWCFYLMIAAVVLHVLQWLWTIIVLLLPSDNAQSLEALRRLRRRRRREPPPPGYVSPPMSRRMPPPIYSSLFPFTGVGRQLGGLLGLSSSNASLIPLRGPQPHANGTILTYPPSYFPNRTFPSTSVLELPPPFKPADMALLSEDSEQGAQVAVHAAHAQGQTHSPLIKPQSAQSSLLSSHTSSLLSSHTSPLLGARHVHSSLFGLQPTPLLSPGLSPRTGPTTALVARPSQAAGSSATIAMQARDSEEEGEEDEDVPLLRHG